MVFQRWTVYLWTFSNPEYDWQLLLITCKQVVYLFWF